MNINKQVRDLKSSGTALLQKKFTPKRQKDAFACYYKASQLDPKDSEIWFKLGEIINDAEIDEEQYVKVKELLSVDSKLTYSKFNQLSCWQKAVKLNPQYVEAWMEIALLYDIQEEYKKAAKTFEKIVQLDPSNFKAWCKMASNYHVLSISGDNYDNIAIKNKSLLEKAVECYNKAINIAPEESAKYEAYYWMAEISLLKKDKHAALAWFDKQIEYTGDKHCKKARKKLENDLD